MVADLVERVLAPNASLMTGHGTNTYLLGRGSLAVIDPGPDLASHVKAVEAAAERRGRIELLLVTHRHQDHLPAARTLRRRLGVPLLAHGSIAGVDRGLEDNELIRLGSLQVRALHTPGHTSDHVCFLVESEGLLFTGDLVVGKGTVVIGPPDGDLGDYMASLDRLLRLASDRVPLTRLLPGHGPAVEQPREKLEEYVQHRRMRESQVVEALGQGCSHVDEIVPLLYADVNPGLHAMAARNVLAHLLKLEQGGCVERRGENWYLT